MIVNSRRATLEAKTVDDVEVTAVFAGELAVVDPFIVTTIAVSEAKAAVEAALTVAVFVPSLTLTDPKRFVPAGRALVIEVTAEIAPVTAIGLFGEMATTIAVSVASAAVDAAFTVASVAGVTPSPIFSTVKNDIRLSTSYLHRQMLLLNLCTES
jgi:hypothetical protein